MRCEPSAPECPRARQHLMPSATRPGMPGGTGSLESFSWGVHIIEMRWVMRQFMMLLTIFAFFGATTLRAMPTMDLSQAGIGTAVTTTGVPCAQPSSLQPMKTATPDHGMPCKRPPSNCLQMAVCTSSPVVSEQPASATGPTIYARVIYSSPTAARIGISREPDLPPPITT